MGTSPCVLYLALWYCFHSHFILVVGMVIRYFLVSSYMWVSSFCICMVFVVVTMSFSGLHSIGEIWVCNISVGCGMNLVSLFCVGLRCVFAISLYWLYCCSV